MRQRLILNLVITAALAASCAGRTPVHVAEAPAAATPAQLPASLPEARVAGAQVAGARMTPVHVDAGGRITRLPDRPAAPDAVLASAEGEATYYASKFDGRRAASGIVFRNSEAYAAHRTYPFGTVVRVTNLANDRSVVVRIVDRGPHGTSARQRRTIIDVSRSAARELDFLREGRVPVRVEVLEWGPGGK